MRLIIFSLAILVFMTGLLCKPVFVLASDTCYVDEDADDDGDGNDDTPYQTIIKALDEECDKIVVEEGTYEDSITIGTDVLIEGTDKEDVIVTGKIKMKDGSSIKNITILGKGVDVLDGADVKIENSDIKEANVGIETTGSGTLTVDNVELHKNRKAFYLQSDKNVKITNSEVYDNKEEGIDIRENVDGIISENSIYNNGESGIEVILGKSDLKIYNNKIKKNSASGIALQYYKHASKLGGVKIKNNTIISNKDYGVNCKIPSGGSPSTDYWTESVEMTANKVYSNKDGEFAAECYFNDEKTSYATKTKKEVKQDNDEMQQKKEQEQKTIEEAKKKNQEKIKQEEEREIKRQQEQEQLRKKLQEEKNLQVEIEEITNEIEKVYNKDTISKEVIEKRSRFILFFVGPDYGELRNIAEDLSVYDEKINFAKTIRNDISDEAIQNNVDENIAKIIQKREEIYNFANEYNNKFSLFGWMIKKSA